MKIDVKKVNDKEFYFCINFLNSKNERVSLNRLDKGYVPFFIDAYRDFISKIPSKRSKNFLGKIKIDLLSIKKLLAKRQLSIFTFLSILKIPDLFVTKIYIYTFDGSDGSCLAQTTIEGGKIKNIFNSYCSNRQLWYLGALNLNFILTSYRLEKEYSLQIIERALCYFRKTIYLGIIILNTYVFYLANKEEFAPLNFSLFGISIIGIPFSRWLFKEGFYYIIERNISALLGTDRRTGEKKKGRDRFSCY
jgi:hypothetical protein